MIFDDRFSPSVSTDSLGLYRPLMLTEFVRLGLAPALAFTLSNPPACITISNVLLPLRQGSEDQFAAHAGAVLQIAIRPRPARLNSIRAHLRVAPL